MGKSRSAPTKYIKDHDFYCTKCGNKGIPICRTNHHNKGPGHLKKMFCLTCNQETNHAECIEGSIYTVTDFMEEYKSGNFTSEGNRRVSIDKAIENLNEWADMNSAADTIVLDCLYGRTRSFNCCKKPVGHIYGHKWGEGFSSAWGWCSNCHSYIHLDGIELPDDWEKPPFIEEDKLSAVPLYLDEIKDEIDAYYMDYFNAKW